jgi:hypothetical protein
MFVMGIFSNPTRQDYGRMLVAPSGSNSAWMILALNILDKKTYNTYKMHNKKKNMTL